MFKADVEWLEVSGEAFNAIKARSSTPDKVIAQKTGKDSFLITLGTDTMDRLRKVKFEQESFSDVIVRVMAVTEKGMN
ncbi:MAG: hypothetical protein HOO86_09945 [Bacteroidales bacterium]|nr:hypothetical protein [Bacteroidales bacterium]